MTVQSVLFPKTIYSVTHSRKWLKEHNYKSRGKVHETQQYYRFRQEIPKQNKKYHTLQIKGGILLIIESNEFQH